MSGTLIRFPILRLRLASPSRFDSPRKDLPIDPDFCSFSGEKPGDCRRNVGEALLCRREGASLSVPTTGGGLLLIAQGVIFGVVDLGVCVGVLVADELCG